LQEDIERRLEEGLNSSDPVDFEDLLRLKPDYVVSYLADKGTQKLGTFVTDVRTQSLAPVWAHLRAAMSTPARAVPQWPQSWCLQDVTSLCS